MLKNVDTKLLTLDGEVAQEGGKEISMKTIIIDCLMDLTLMEQNTSGEQKLNQYLLAVRCNKGGEVEFNVDELSLLKKLSAKKYSPLVIGQLYKFLE